MINNDVDHHRQVGPNQTVTTHRRRVGRSQPAQPAIAKWGQIKPSPRGQIRLSGSVSTVYSDSTDASESAWACNDIDPWWGVLTSRFRALTLFDEAIETEVPYGRCQQV